MAWGLVQVQVQVQVLALVPAPHIPSWRGRFLMEYPPKIYVPRPAQGGQFAERFPPDEYSLFVVAPAL